MNRLTGVVVGAWLIVGATFTSAGGGDKKIDPGPLDNPYYPLKVGTTWEYKSGGKIVVVKVAAQETIDGMVCARVETDIPGGKVSEHLTVKPEGIYRVRSNNQDIKPPLQVLKFAPNQKVPQKDDHWFFECMVQNYTMKGKFTVLEDKLVIGQTTYAALGVKSSDLIMGNQVVSMETWYAKEVGMVKQHLKVPAADLDVTLELEKFTPGK